MRVSPIPVARSVGSLYVNTIRNTPLTLVFFAFAFALPPLLGLRLTADVSLTLAVCALGIYTATYVAETYFPSARVKVLSEDVADVDPSVNVVVILGVDYLDSLQGN